MSGGFDPKAYLQESDTPKMGGFDPKAYLAEGGHGMDVADTGGASQAALEHFGNAASMGYLPQLQALAEKLTPNPGSDVDAKLKAQGFTVSGPDDSYLASRDANIARLAKEGQDHPVASGVGTAAGILSSGIAMGGMGGARAATAAGRIAQGIKTGALMGAAANPGDTEGEIDPLQLGARLDNAKTGALTGGAVSGAVEAIPTIIKGLGFAARKVGNLVSGVPQGEIDNYAARTDEINKMINESGGDITAAADKARQETQNAIRAKRQQLSQQVGNALQAAGDDKNLSANSVIDQLEKAKGNINAKLNPEAISQIDEMSQRIKSLADENGNLSASEMHQVKEFLQDRASGAYIKNGQIFQGGKDASQAAKGAAAIARKTINAAVPDVANANNQLSYLHNLESQLNKNLIAPGKSESALLAAGSGSNPRNAAMIGRLDQAAGTNLAQKAKDLATARTFASPALLPMDATGKTATRMLIAAGAGHLLAGPAGYAAGALASPAAVKLGINAANVATPALTAVGRAVQNNPVLLQRIAQNFTTPTQNQSSSGPTIDQETLGVFRSNPSLIDSVADPAIKRAIQKQMSINRSPSAGADSVPAKGPDSWAQSGVKNLGLDQDTASRVLKSPQGKQLLIQASDLKPGSKAMTAIMTQIQKGFGNKK